MWCSNLYSYDIYDIKVKRIECDNHNYKARHHNKFIIISSDSKKAKIYSVSDSYRYGNIWTKDIPKYFIKEYSVLYDLLEIRFSGKSDLDNFPKTKYVLNRENGNLNYLTDSSGWKCFKMDDDFDPEEYVIETVNKMLEDQENKNKF